MDSELLLKFIGYFPDYLLDCSQSPIFPWDFRDSNASIELPPSLFVRASATWGECLNYLTRAPLVV